MKRVIKRERIIERVIKRFREEERVIKEKRVRKKVRIKELNKNQNINLFCVLL